ncbi:hypothetical protein OQ257_08575 [Actinobacillus equuli subsp. equuli]|uniref:YubB ferredoxin-like domain-containing protein n=1 Tax=Actinobacillus equuli subsp. equuli TaxID=202947 RepID=A0A9X4JCW0_ACTEU|nr:hypothetical protein [Actinobacillus equuli]MDE8035217.1 hypothetical protein [Actinobacillus equuli subsp. equuli]
MPNWCENKLQILCSAEQSKILIPKLFTQINEDQWCLDFDLLVPMPEDLHINSDSIGANSQRLLELPHNKPVTYPMIKKYLPLADANYFRKKAKQHHWKVSDLIRWLAKRPVMQKRIFINLEHGQRYIDNLAKYGYTDWYNWSCANWGCKWNVCEDSCSPCFNPDGSIDCFFDTAWNPPEAWFSALCEAFPDIEFTLSFYEPGVWFAGEYVANLDGTYHEIIVDDCEIQGFAEDIFGAEFENDHSS